MTILQQFSAYLAEGKVRNLPLPPKYKGWKATTEDGYVVITFNGKEIATGDFDSGADGYFIDIPGKRGQKFYSDTTDAVDALMKMKLHEGMEEPAPEIQYNRIEALKILYKNGVADDNNADEINSILPMQANGHITASELAKFTQGITKARAGK